MEPTGRHRGTHVRIPSSSEVNEVCPLFFKSQVRNPRILPKFTLGSQWVYKTQVQGQLQACRETQSSHTEKSPT